LFFGVECFVSLAGGFEAVAGDLVIFVAVIFGEGADGGEEEFMLAEHMSGLHERSRYDPVTNLAECCQGMLQTKVVSSTGAGSVRKARPSTIGTRRNLSSGNAP
jgi:hypothetical protein